MEPTIYKPSIYNGAGIYKTEAGGGGGGGELPKVEILGKNYHYTKIGNLYWTCENLAYDDPSFRHDLIYENDRTIKRCLTYATFNNAGYLYSDAAAYYIKSLLNNGWRLPTEYDIKALDTIIDSKSRYLVPTDSNTWDNLQYTPDNVFKFSALACGCWSAGNLIDINNIAYFVGNVTGITGNDNAKAYRIQNNKNNFIYGGGSVSPLSCYNIRLCKDV